MVLVLSCTSSASFQLLPPLPQLPGERRVLWVFPQGWWLTKTCSWAALTLAALLVKHVQPPASLASPPKPGLSETWWLFLVSSWGEKKKKSVAFSRLSWLLEAGGKEGAVPGG